MTRQTKINVALLEFGLLCSVLLREPLYMVLPTVVVIFNLAGLLNSTPD